MQHNWKNNIWNNSGGYLNFENQTTSSNLCIRKYMRWQKEMKFCSHQNGQILNIPEYCTYVSACIGHSMHCIPICVHCIMQPKQSPPLHPTFHSIFCIMTTSGFLSFCLNISSLSPYCTLPSFNVSLCSFILPYLKQSLSSSLSLLSLLFLHTSLFL